MKVYLLISGKKGKFWVRRKQFLRASGMPNTKEGFDEAVAALEKLKWRISGQSTSEPKKGVVSGDRALEIIANVKLKSK